MGYWSLIQRKSQGFTLIELILVIIILGIIAVYASPRIFTGTSTAEAVIDVQVLSLLRLQQQRAMQDVIQPCYGVRIEGGEIRTRNCNQANRQEDSFSLPASVTLTAISGFENAASGFNFNSLGCPVSINHEVVNEQCGSGTVQLTFVGQDTQSVCVQSQGYMRRGEC